jgi:hypothetical protein
VAAISMDDRDRITRLETRCQSLATKADLAELKADFKGELHALESRLTKWMIGLMFGSITAAVAIATAVDRFAG